MPERVNAKVRNYDRAIIITTPVRVRRIGKTSCCELPIRRGAFDVEVSEAKSTPAYDSLVWSI